MNAKQLFLGLVTAGLVMHSTLVAQPDLVFAQMAVGSGGGLEIETIVTFTNSGATRYNGTLRFWTGNGKIWNPEVGGQPINNGQLAVSIEPLATVSLVLTGTDLTAGSGILIGNSASPSLVEATLTYLFRSGGTIVDSVGVTPSVGLLRATIPFEEFETIGLALANDRPTPNTVGLILRDEIGTAVETVEVQLDGNAHTSQFLNQYFSADTVTRGRVDIESDTAVYGTAVTLVGGQISTLPMRASPVEYAFRADADDGTVTLGTVSLQITGIFLSGFLELTAEDGVLLPQPARTPISGRLIDGDLRVTFFAGGPEFFGEDIVIDALFPDFSFGQSSISAHFTELFLSELSIETGTFQLTRTE